MIHPHLLAQIFNRPHMMTPELMALAVEFGRAHLLVGTEPAVPEMAIRATEANVYRGDQAVAAGLADRVGTLRQALADLGASLTRPSARSPVLSRPKETTMSEQTGDIPVEAAAQQPPAIATAEIEQRLRAEYSEISAIAAQAARLGITIDAADALAKGIRPEALRRTVLEQLAARSDATAVVAAAPAPAAKTETESPIVRRAREAAARK